MTIQDVPEAAWAPPHRCGVPRRKPKVPVQERPDRKALEAVRRIVDERGDSPAAQRLDKAVSALARWEPGPGLAPVLGRVLADPAVRAVDRAVAAAELARAPAAAAEPVLIAALQEPEPMVRRRVISSLGAVGGLKALRALNSLRADPGLRSAAEFAALLIEHRVGARTGEPPEPRGTRWDPQLEGPVLRVPLRAMSSEETAARTRGLAGRSYGIDPSDTGFAFGTETEERHLLVDRAVAGPGGWRLLLERPAIVGLVSRDDGALGTEAIETVVLATPAAGDVLFRGFRPDGALVFEGLGSLAEGDLRFVLTSTDRPGQCRYRIRGSFGPDGVRVDQVESLARTRGRQVTAA